MTRLAPPLSITLPDAQVDRVTRNLQDKVREIQSLPFADAVVIQGVTLADGVTTPVAHVLGRSPIWVSPSAPRGPSSTGRIEEVRSEADRSKTVSLRATGWGATITVDVVVI